MEIRSKKGGELPTAAFNTPPLTRHPMRSYRLVDGWCFCICKSLQALTTTHAWDAPLTRPFYAPQTKIFETRKTFRTVVLSTFSNNRSPNIVLKPLKKCWKRRSEMFFGFRKSSFGEHTFNTPYFTAMRCYRSVDGYASAVGNSLAFWTQTCLFTNSLKLLTTNCGQSPKSPNPDLSFLPSNGVSCPHAHL
jgi:hypothetical protein